jgi:hypothetical protein
VLQSTSCRAPPTLCSNTPPAGSNETLCPSHSKLTGTTTIIAKPGMGDKLMEMVATMPGEWCLHADLHVGSCDVWANNRAVVNSSQQNLVAAHLSVGFKCHASAK